MLAYCSTILAWLNLVRYEFFLVDQRALTCYLLKIFMKGSKIIEAALITKALDTFFILNKQFAGMANP